MPRISKRPISAKARKRRHQRMVSRLLKFPEPPPAMDVNDPRWPDAFTAWCQRKAEWYGMDAIEMLGRALGCKKEADQWRESQAEQRRKAQERLRHMEETANHIYGKPANDGTQRPGTPDGPLATETRKPGSLK